ncbi:MAG: DUF1549 domain-containing protein [Planctomycetota bacterium]
MKRASIFNPLLSVAITLSISVFSVTVAAAVEDPNEPNPRKSARSIPRENVLAISSRIDTLVEAKLTANGQKRNPRSSDDVFLRRVYLDITGRIPSLQETKSFLNDKSKDKRAELIDELLDSYGFTSRQFNYWADLLRIKSNMPGGLTGRSYIDYVKDSLEANKPYDEFVRDMVESEGANLQRGNGAVGYYLRDRNMPEDNMSNTIRIFLGTRLECAQCHDHPFDKWTQRQYFEMVAFTGGINYRAGTGMQKYNQIRKEYRNNELPEKLRPIMNRLSQTLQHGVRGSGTGLARLPENFLGDDGFDGEIIVAKEMFKGKAITKAEVPQVKSKKSPRRRPNAQQSYIPGAKEINSRKIYARWLTDSENPRFATVIANRLWKQAFGVGLIEPVDIIEDETVASNQELMDFLTKTMVELDFDMKQYLRAIYNSETYQATAYRTDITDASKFYFNGPRVRRMSAEQIWDSLLTLTLPNIDKRYDANMSRYTLPGVKDPYDLYDRLMEADADEILGIAEELADSRDKSRRKSNYKNDPDYKRMQSEKAALNQKLKQARKQKNTTQIRKLMIESAKLTNEFRQSKQAGQYQRASELQSPAPASHFLREFGQSDRETIDNSNTDPAVTQVLAMMNGYVEQRIARDQSSLLMQEGIKAKSSNDCVDAVFLSMLNRKPKSKERRVWSNEFDQAYKKKDQTKIKEIFTDLIWTLANSNEFIFIK